MLLFIVFQYLATIAPPFSHEKNYNDVFLHGFTVLSNVQEFRRRTGITDEVRAKPRELKVLLPVKQLL